jgi:hypothetical protein
LIPIIAFIVLLLLWAVILFTPFTLDINVLLNFPIDDKNNSRAEFDLYVNIVFFNIIKIKVPYDKVNRFIKRQFKKNRARKASSKGVRGIGRHNITGIRPPRKAGAAEKSKRATRAAAPKAVFRVTLLNVKAALGAGDSALTALSAGAVYWLITAPAAALFNYAGGAPAAFAVNVEPDFKKIGFYVEGRCILSAKPANIILKYLMKGRN